MRDKCWGCGRIHDLDTACLDAAGGRIAQLEADMGSLQSHYAHEVSQRTALADELANANRRIEAHGPICLKWQYALHDADTRIRALEADIADVAKINVDLMKRNRELEAQMRGQTFQTPDEKDARIGKLEAELGQWRQRGSIVGVIIRDEEGKDWKWDGSQWCAFGSTVEAKAFVIHSDSCPVRRPDFVPIEGVTQCNCDFGKRLAAAMGVPITAETKGEQG